MAGNYRFNADAPVDRIQRALQRHGCAIVENVLSKDDLNEVRRQTARRIAKMRGDPQNDFNGEFTVRFDRLMWRVPKAREIVRHPLIMELCRRNLLPYAPAFKLTFDGIMHVMAGQKQQVLHRDNVPWVNDPKTPPVLFATLWAIEDFRRSNGGTVFVPGSHKWHERRAPKREELACCEMPAGSVLLYYGNLIHGAGKSTEGTRQALSLQYAVSWLQQEENQAFSTPMRVLRTFDEELLGLLGIAPVSRNWGSVDGKHPVDHVLRDGKYRSLDQPGNAFTNGRTRALKFRAGKIRTEDCFYDATLDEP